MRVPSLLICLLISLLAQHALADVPTAEQLQQPVKNYQPINTHIATSGTLSRENLEQLHQQGIQQIIDLRQPGEGIAEERGWSADIGVEYANFPVGRSLPDAALIEQVGALLDQAPQSATLLHCGSGHRAGIVLAMYLHQRGATPAEAIAQARTAGTRESAIPALQQRLLENAE